MAPKNQLLTINNYGKPIYCMYIYSTRISTDAHLNWATHPCLTWNLSSRHTTNSFFDLKYATTWHLQLQKKKTDCPLEGKCLQSNVIYQASVTTETSTDWQQALRNISGTTRHPFDTRAKEMKQNIQLSKHVWTSQEAKKPFQIKWKVLKKCKPYSNISKKCNLSLHEKFIIICKKTCRG